MLALPLFVYDVKPNVSLPAVWLFGAIVRRSWDINLLDAVDALLAVSYALPAFVVAVLACPYALLAVLRAVFA